MAFRMSDRDKAAIQAAAAIRQANRAQRDYEDQAAQAQANLSQAQSRPMGGLESVLAGIGEKFNDWGNTIGNIGRTVIGAVSEPFSKAETDRINSDDSARRNEIAKRYGFSSYSEAVNSDRASQDFWNEIKGVTKATQQRLKNKMESDRNSLGNVRDIDLNTAKGQALSTASDVLQALGPIGNVVGGAVEGVGSSYKNAAGGTDSDVWGGDNLGRTLGNAAIGGVTAFIGDKVGGKLASKAPGDGILSRAIHSNVGRGTIAGAAAGATGGGLGAALNGGDVLQGTLQGGLGGAMAGGTMAGTMGVLGSGIDRLNRKFNAEPQTPDVPTSKPIVDEVAEQYTKPATIETALQEAQAQPTRRSIPITDYDAGEQNVRVRRPDTEYSLGRRQGSNIDGILAPNNKRQLPNAQVDTQGQFNRLFDNETNDLSDAIKRGYLDVSGDDALSNDGVLRGILNKDTYNDLKNSTRDYADMMNDIESVTGGAASAKSSLPKIRTSDYIEATGYKGKDIPDYMRPFLSEDGVPLGSSDWAETIPKYNEGGQFTGTPDDIIDFYDSMAKTNNSVKYTNDNALGALGMDSDLNKRVNQEFLNDSYPTRKIEVNKAPSISENIDVENYRDDTPVKRTLNAPQAQTPEPEQRAVRSNTRRSTDLAGLEVDPSLSAPERAKLERQIVTNRQKQGAALLGQYGTLEAPVRRAVGSPEDVLATLYDEYGLTTPADVQYASSHVTGADGVVSQMTRELARKADRVQTGIDKAWLDEMMDLNGLTDEEAKVVTKQITAALKRTGADGYSDGNTALDAVKQIEKQTARYKGKDGTYHRETPEDARKAVVLDMVRDELQGRIWDAAGDASSVLTPQRLNELKSMYPDNSKWANFVDNKLGQSRTGADLRSAMKPLVDGSKIVNGSKVSAGSFANRVYKAATSANPFVAGGQILTDMALGSDAAKQYAANHYAKKAAQAQAKLTGQTPAKSGSGVVGGAKNIASKVANKVSGVTDMLNNETLTGSALGRFATMAGNRRIGQGEAQAVENRAALQDATQQLQDIKSNYDNAMAQAQQMYSQAQQAQDAVPDTLNRISVGMERALAAGDINAYSTLAGLYKQALQLQQLQNPTSSSQTKALSATQSKALTGLQQLQTLANMTPDLGTALANSPLGGVVDMLGGNDYANQAKSLSLTLGYLQSGANITPREAENIGKSYIPTAYDSENVRQQKLSRAEQLLRNYLADTSALQ